MTTTDQFGAPGRGEEFGTPGRSRIAADYTDAEARAAQNLPIDQWGRYRIPSPDGIQPAVNKGRTRVSTTKGVGQDQSRIQARTERLIVKGLAANAELAQKAYAALLLEDDSKAQRKALAAVAAAAFVAAGGDDRKDQGTEVHQLIDDILRGKAPEVPEKYQRDVTAYFDALKEFGLEPVPGLSEIVVLCPFEHGGAIDNIMRWWNPDTEMYELVVVDTKTGRTLENSRVEFLSQTWMYSNALYSFVVTGMDRDKDGKLTAVRGYTEELPLELRRDKAIIIHLPMDGTAEAVLLDLSGWDRIVAAQIAIRQANAEAKYRYRSLGVIRPEAFIEPTNWVQRGGLQRDGYTPGTTVQIATDLVRAEQEYLSRNSPSTLPPVGALGAAVIPTDGSVQPVPLAAQGRMTVADPPLTQGPAAGVPWAVETGNGADAPPVSVLTQALDEITAGQARAQQVADQIIDNLTIEAHTGHLAGTVRHIEQLGQPGTTPIDMSKGEFNPNQPATSPAGSNPLPAVERDPVTGRKKRTCGYCHKLPQDGKPGHTQKNCPENPASAKYTGGMTSPAVMLGGAANDAEPQEAADAELAQPVSEQARANVATALEAAPFCTLAHAHTWTSSHPAAPGHWVCSVSGKPGRAAYEAERTAVTNEAPFYGSPQEGVNDAPPVPDVLATDAAVNPTGLAATGWPSAPPSLLDLITQAPTQSAVLALRQQHLEAGTWTPEHDAAGMVRYQALAAS